MKKNIAVFGTGYVGLVTSAGLADIGHNVTAVDIDRSRVKELKKGYVPFYEPGLKKILKGALSAGKIHFTADCGEAVCGSDVLIIAVGTPSRAEGRVDLSQVRNAFDSISENIDSGKTIIIKSTVPPGTVDSLREQYSAEFEAAGTEIVFCPEFLREGTAVHDFYYPDRLVIGSPSGRAAKIVEEIFFPVIGKSDVPVLKCSPVSAEMIKYSSNVMLAARIAVINELAELSEAVGGDMRVISSGVGLDKRIGGSFLKAGPGFGGSCFGKDLSGIIAAAEYRGVDMGIAKEILASNIKQKLRPALRLEKALGGLKGKRVAVLGLSFKAETDDVRGSAAFEVVDYLLDKGASVRAHDPAAEYNFIRDFGRKGYSCTDEVDAALVKADAAIILTGWEEYGKLTPDRLKALMRGLVLVDSRNVLDEAGFREGGFTVCGTGRPAAKPCLRNRKRGDIVNAAIISVN